MRITLVSCGICSHWHMPSAHAGHCPNCGARPLHVAKRTTRYYIVKPYALRATQIVCGLLNSLRGSVLNTMITK